MRWLAVAAEGVEVQRDRLSDERLGLVDAVAQATQPGRSGT